MDDTIGVDIKANFDLRDTTRSGSNAIEAEAAQSLIISSHLTLTLQDMNLN